jgi:serine/threonine-protein kinase
MGQVFLARVDETGQQVALKVLSPSRKPSSVREAIERFTRESKALAGLDHPGAVRFVDAGVQGGFHYLAMEYVEGRDLQVKVRDDGPLAPAEVVLIGLALCDCLQAAHAKGMLHRDVKPSNVFRAKADGFVKLADFGLAHLAQSHGIGGSKLSTAGGGNPRYAAPEQLRRLKDAGIPADVYGVGATLFFCLTGRPPFDHKSKAVAAVQAIEEPAPDVRGINPKCPAKLAAVIAKCLAKEPKDRFATAKALASALKKTASS